MSYIHDGTILFLIFLVLMFIPALVRAAIVMRRYYREGGSSVDRSRDAEDAGSTPARPRHLFEFERRR